MQDNVTHPEIMRTRLMQQNWWPAVAREGGIRICESCLRGQHYSCVPGKCSCVCAEPGTRDK